MSLQTVCRVETDTYVKRYTCEGHANGAHQLRLNLNRSSIVGEAGSYIGSVADTALKLDDVLVWLLLAGFCLATLDEGFLLLAFLNGEGGRAVNDVVVDLRGSASSTRGVSGCTLYSVLIILHIF